MIYDFSFLWIWLIITLALGVIVGWATETGGPQAPWFYGWFRGALIAFCVGVAVAWFRWLPGWLGFWLETALIYFAFYVVGCLLGGLLRNVFVTPEPAAAGPSPGRSWPFRLSDSFSAFGPSAGQAVGGNRGPSAAAAPVPSEPAGDAPKSSAVSPESAAGPSDPAVVAPKTFGVVLESGAVAPEPAVVAPRAFAVIPESAPVAPAAVGPVEGEDRHEGKRPAGFVAPHGGVPDDLKRIKGIGPQNEGRLHALGIWHFHQIASWTPDNVRWVGSYLAFPGRIDREQWIAQATTLAQGRETDFSLRVERGEVPKSHDGGAHGQDNIADVSKMKPRN